MLVQCSACGYIMDPNEAVCVRCNTPVSPNDAAQPAPGEPGRSAPPPPFGMSPPSFPTPSTSVIGRAAPRSRGERWTKGNIVLAASVIGLFVAAAVAGALFIVPAIKDDMARKEREGVLKTTLARQPDFRANIHTFENGQDFTGLIARRDRTLLVQVLASRALLLHDPSRSGKMAVMAIVAPGDKVQVVVPEYRAYVEVAASDIDVPIEDPWSTVARIVKDDACQVEELGTKVINGYDVKLVRLSDRSGKREPAYLSYAPALENLIVEMDISPDWTNGSNSLVYSLMDVSLDVDEELFRVPVTYRKAGP